MRSVQVLSCVACKSCSQQFKKSWRIRFKRHIAICGLAGHAPDIADGSAKTWTIAAIDLNVHGFDFEQSRLEQVRDHARIVQSWPGEIITALVCEFKKLEQFGGEVRDSSAEGADAFGAFWRGEHLMRQVQAEHG